MKRLPAILISAAILTACGSAAGGSTSVRDSASTVAVQVNQAVSADSEREVNPPITKGARPTPAGAVRPQTVMPNAVQPAAPADRCSGTATGGGFGSSATGSGSGKHFPLPLCPPQ